MREKRNEVRRRGLVLAVLVILGVAGFLAAASLAAPTHQNPCHSQHSCPSDHATYLWVDGNGQAWSCVEPGAREFDSSFSTTIVYAGLPYYCKTAGSPPPPPPPTTTTVAPPPTTTTTPAPPTITTTAPPTTTITPPPPPTAAPPTTPALTVTLYPLGRSVLLGPRSKTSACKRGPSPDRRCSPGAYYTGLTKAVLCSAGFRTGSVRNVPTSLKHTIEHEYGMSARSYGSTLEIDHIISLELGGSNDAANLFPESAPGYHVKDRLENRLHQMVCSGAISLRAAQAGIASNWQALSKRVFG